MISWIKGEIISTWHENQKLFLLISCQGLGYEIQTLNSVKTESNKKNITLWIEHIKREDSDFLFGFVQKDERDFFRDLLKVRGIGPQIGMSLLNKYSINEVKTSLIKQNKDLISSVPGIGKKMTERIFLELKNKITLIEEDSNKKSNHNYSDEMTFIFEPSSLTGILFFNSRNILSVIFFPIPGTELIKSLFCLISEVLTSFIEYLFNKDIPI